MANFHGVYVNEAETALSAPSVIDNSITVAVGTAPVHKAAKKAGLNQAVIAYRYSEFVEQFGYSDNFEDYTLCGVAKTFFSLYNISPVVFINVLNPEKHYEGIEKEVGLREGGSVIFEGDIDLKSLKVTSGADIPVNIFESGIDFEVRIDEVEDLDEEETLEIPTLHILNGDKVVDNKIKVFYRLQHEALGGTEHTTEVTLHNALFYELPEDTLIESVRVESGGNSDLVELIADEDYEVSDAGTFITLTLLKDEKVIDNKVKVSYHEIDPSKVTAADVVGGVDLATGKSTGLELIESVHPNLGIVPGTLIAPKFSMDSSVAAALTSKAKKVSGIFPAVAIADLDSSKYKNYGAAVANKNSLNLSDGHLILCYPKIKSGSDIYYMSEHLAALMGQVDYENDGVPYVSPSNQSFQMDAAVLADGTEIYLTQEQANLLNQNGIVTAFRFGGWKCWGNYLSVGESGDVKDKFISVRRMFNYISNYLATTYFSHLDLPLTRRRIDNIINSTNIYLNGLMNMGVILGGRLELSSENTVTDLMNGLLRMHLYITPPVPLQTLIFTLEYDTNYLSELLG